MSVGTISSKKLGVNFSRFFKKSTASPETILVFSERKLGVDLLDEVDDH